MLLETYQPTMARVQHRVKVRVMADLCCGRTKPLEKIISKYKTCCKLTSDSDCKTIQHMAKVTSGDKYLVD